MRGIKRRLVAFAARFRAPLIVALTAFIVSYVDPLGIEEATGDHAMSTIMRLSSTLLPGSGQVTVVLIDQAYLDLQPNPSWPLSYGDQGVLLRQIANKAPAAVFVDLLYKNPHRNAPALLTASNATDADQRDVPADLLKPIQSMEQVHFYFAALPKYGGVKDEADELDAASFAPGLDERGKLKPAAEKQLALVSWSGYGDYYPLRLGRAGALRTPAYALYQDQCIARKLPCADPRRRDDEPMMVRWGAFVPRNVADHIAAGVCQYTDFAERSNYPGPWLRLRAMAWQFVLALADPGNEATDVDSRLPCMSFVVLPASFLSDASGSRNEALIDAALRNKFVFVGADIPGIPDRTTSPVHGQMAGVMLHAMAMENLLVGDGSHVRATPEWFTILVKLVILCAVAIAAVSFRIEEGGIVHTILVVMGVCAWLVCAAFSFMHDDTNRGMLFLIGGAAVTWVAAAETGKIILLFIAISALALLMIEFGWEPTNWITLSVAAILVHQIAKHLPERRADDTLAKSSETDISGGKGK